MILNSKQLEELENIQDASGEFEEESSDPDGYVEGVENALAWRRGMIERAVINIRKLLRKPVESMENLSNGSLVYLKDSKRFVRIHENQDGNTELSFVGPTPLAPLASGKGEKPAKAPKAPKAEKPVKAAKPAKEQEPAKEAKIKAEKPTKPAKVEIPRVPEKTVAKAKEMKAPPQMAKAPKPESKKEKPAVKAKAQEKIKAKVSVSKKASAKSSAERVTKKVPLKPKKKAVKVLPKPKTKKAAAKKAVAKAKPKAVSKKPVAKKLPRKSAEKLGSGRTSSKYMMDPVADPNSYIRSNFRLMSNKELSHVTGLSEHTIRRKLGEWGLKRI